MKDILQPLVNKFMPFAQKRMGFHKPPRVFLRDDPQNAQNPLGKTAYYNPEQMSVTLYIHGRHPKDIMRSLSHELVHHTQNCNGEFDNASEMGEGYAQNDAHLREMERQAYEQGNLCFRDWEDSIKNTIYNENLNIGIQKKGKNKMSIKDWKNRELPTLLTEKWGFSFNLLTESQGGDADCPECGKDSCGCPSTLQEGGAAARTGNEDKDQGRERMHADRIHEEEGAFAPNHYCVHHGGVERNGSIELAEAVGHNYNKELGRVTHYDMKFADGTIMENVAFEDIQVTNASLAEMHGSHPAKRDDDEEVKEAKKMPMKDEPEGEDLNKDGKKGHGKVPAFLDEKEKMDESQIRNIIRKLVKEAINKKAAKAKSKG